MIVDIAVLIILILSTLVGLMRGFSREILSIAAWVGAAIATLYGFEYIAPIARQWISLEIAANIVAGVALFLVSLFIFWIITHLMARRVRESALDALDRSLGLLFGLVRGAALIITAFLLISWFSGADGRPDWINAARTLPAIEQATRWVCALAPGDISNSCKDLIQSRNTPAFDATKAFRELSSPPTKGGAPAPQSGYKDADRQEMDRLIRNAR